MRTNPPSSRCLTFYSFTGAHPECTVAIEADSAIIHLDKLRDVLAESGVLPRVRSLDQMCWGVKGHAASFGHNVEVWTIPCFFWHHWVAIFAADVGLDGH